MNSCCEAAAGAKHEKYAPCPVRTWRVFISFRGGGALMVLVFGAGLVIGLAIGWGIGVLCERAGYRVEWR